jgi:DTW domain-containing protein YfiP
VVAAPDFVPRERCARCRRPTVVCYCAALPSIETATRVIILQHPRERDMPIGTARMATLCLPNSELLVGMRWGEHARFTAAIADPARTPILLYPGADAKDLLAEPPQGPVTLVMVDGTWSQAKTLVRDNPILQSLPRYAFRAPEASHYRIRKEPRDEYCSTIEALMHSLGALEHDPAKFRALLDPFHKMVDAQLAAQAARPLRRFRAAPRTPADPRSKLPDNVRDRLDDLVVIVAEANAWPYQTTGVKPPDELVHLVACRVATGEVFDRIAAPAGALAPSTSFHCRIPDEDLLAGEPCAELIDAFNRWLRPTDVVAAWGYYTPDLVIAAGARLPERLDVRFVAQRLLHRKFGSLEALAAEIGPPTPPLAAGRAGHRLGALAQIVGSWPR